MTYSFNDLWHKDKYRTYALTDIHNYAYAISVMLLRLIYAGLWIPAITAVVILLIIKTYI